MSVLINMEMPTSPVLFCIHPDGKVFADLEGGWREYKAIPVPPHGRLGDLDALLEWANADLRFGDPDFHAGLWHTISAIEDAPTIIPESKEGE